MSLPPALDNVKKRPGMYLSKVEFDTAVAFVNGYNLAASGGLLVGFREWLIVRLGYGSNWTWDGLVLELTFPEAESPSGRLLRPEDQKRAVESLFGLLEAFLAERWAADGLRRIFLRYEEWLKCQEWYGPSSPHWIGEDQRKGKRNGQDS